MRLKIDTPHFLSYRRLDEDSEPNNNMAYIIVSLVIIFCLFLILLVGCLILKRMRNNQARVLNMEEREEEINLSIYLEHGKPVQEIKRDNFFNQDKKMETERELDPDKVLMDRKRKTTADFVSNI
jgi:hypothetical protein